MRLVKCDNCGKIEEESKAYRLKGKEFGGKNNWYYQHGYEFDACSLECHKENSKEPLELDQ